MCTHFYLQYQSQELKDIMQEAVIMPEEKINEWISPDSKPEDILPYALTDLIMKKTLCIMTALLMLMASFTLAEASDPADDKIIERFSDTWVADGLALEIWSEDNTIHCRGTLGDGGDESDSWEYATCRYDAASDSLQCADGTRTHEVYDAGTQENTDVVTVTGLTAVVFFQEGEDKLIWDDSEGMLKDFVYREQCQPFGIYSDGRMVGYVIVVYDYDIPEYDIWHMMIDESVQGRGYGGEALDRVIEYIRTKPFGDSDRIALTCNKNNAAARKLYESRGFSATGVEDEDEVELVLTTG